ncbi:MAG: myo-inositol-1(or 4)-monophosphatase [Nitriliruptoraceae bacterium]
MTSVSSSPLGPPPLPALPLPALLPPVAVPDVAVLSRVTSRALAMLHPLLDELRVGPLDRSGRTAHTVKPDGSPVTPVDVEVDERIVAAVAATFDGHGVVSEELDAVAGDHEWQWVVDPVDGTSNFAAGLPHWGVAIALCHGGVPVLGVVDAPDLDRRWVAVRGDGCTRDGAPVRVRTGVTINDPLTAHLPLFSSLSFLRQVRPRAGVRLNPRVLGAMAVDAALVADGVGVASAHAGGRVWDVAASAVLVTEAGGAAVALGDPVFPLVAGLDHAHVRVPSAFGTSQQLLEQLIEALTPEDRPLLSP